ncbi:MAG: DUF4299 domain-containing protein [Bacilli bacterium]|nr:DUF4299 domain-containing protein [Bacilli bacterium]
MKKNIEFKDILTRQMRFGIMDESYHLEEGVLGENMVVFPAEHICRGCEISFTKEEIHLSMPLPTSRDDIFFFYDFINRICKKVHTQKFIRNHEILSLDKISCCIEWDIQASCTAIVQMEKNLAENQYESLYIFGAMYPIALGLCEMKKISGDVIKFGELMHSLQSMDIYYAKAKVYERQDKGYFGVYVLTEDIPTVLPYKPKLLMIEHSFEVQDWNIGFVVNNEVKGFISYSNFLDSIGECAKYDAEHFIVTMSSDKMNILIRQYKIDL